MDGEGDSERRQAVGGMEQGEMVERVAGVRARMGDEAGDEAKRERMRGAGGRGRERRVGAGACERSSRNEREREEEKEQRGRMNAYQNSVLFVKGNRKRNWEKICSSSTIRITL
ncbi:uncharacterized protein A4U43_C08F10780 [Asparagus officinalis]|nr:uncharacterized protein A4U43_C08F10780 [Asparagus officinalis]